MTQRKTTDDLFVHLLSDIDSAEKQLTKALARLSRAASDPQLSDAFRTHLEETQGQVERIGVRGEGRKRQGERNVVDRYSDAEAFPAASPQAVRRRGYNHE